MRRTGLMRVAHAGVGILACISTVSCHSGPSLAAMLADVQNMEVDSNPGRREALTAMLEERGIPFELESFQIEPNRFVPRTTGTNIVVTIGEGSSDIVIGAHYDAIWLGGGTLSRGAVDNAASAVILTRLAETLQDETLRHRVRIAFFDMEEIGLRGSRSYIESHDADEIEAAINLDVNGFGDTLFFGPDSVESNAPLFDLMAASCEDYTFACRRFAAYPDSDHLSFQRAGIPNISFSVLPSDETDELWTFLNGTPEQRAALGRVPAVLALIHTSEDTSEHIDPTGMAITYRAVLDLVRKLDRVEP